MSAISFLLLVSLLGTGSVAVDTTVNPSLDAALRTAATQLDRLHLLANNSQWVFNFKAQPSYTYSPGSVVNANAAPFPALTTFGITLAMLNLGYAPIPT
jgi:hypothetical protein